MATPQKTALMETDNKYKENNGHVLTHVQTIRHATKAVQKPINPNINKGRCSINGITNHSNVLNTNGTTNHSNWIAHVIVSDQHALQSCDNRRT